MKTLVKSTFILVISFLCCSLNAFAQPEVQTEAPLPPIILRKYSEEKVAEMRKKDPDKLITLKYYYTSSFILESLNCTDCVFYDTDQFDVSRYEKKRKLHERWVHDFEKYGYRLILLATDELEHRTPEQQIRLDYE